MATELVAELKQTDDEITEAAANHQMLAGGLLKTLVAVRLEVLRTTRALLRQRILAEESGAPVTIEVAATLPDLELSARLAVEIEAQQRILDTARAEAARFTGGLVHALKRSTVATHEQSLSMLRQRYLVARLGLHVPAVATTTRTGNAEMTVPETAGEPGMPSLPAMLEVRLLKKQYREQNHEDYIFFDIEFAAMGLKRPATAIKGVLKLEDLFGETKLTIGWTIDRRVVPGETFVERGQGFDYNQYMQSHQWVNSTPLDRMLARFDVSNILYQDGSRDDF